MPRTIRGKKGSKSQGHTIGRPKVELTDAQWDDFKKLCVLQATEEEVAGFFDMSIDSLRRRCQEHFKDEETGKGMSFAEVYKRFSADGKISLRRVQFEQATKKNNITMQIWLGQQMLGQANRHHQSGGNSDNDERQVEFDIHEKLYTKGNTQ